MHLIAMTGVCEICSVPAIFPGPLGSLISKICLRVKMMSNWPKLASLAKKKC